MHKAREWVKDGWENNPRLRQFFSVTSDDDGISWAAPNDRTQLQWPVIQGVSETRRLILLHCSSREVYPIPKRAFPTPESLRDFKEMLSIKVPVRSQGFPVVGIRNEQRP